MGVQVEWGKSPHDTTSRSSSTPRWQPQQLSGGQMQQVTLTRALVKRPKLLLLDDRKSLRVSKMLLDHRLHDGCRADRALRQRHRVRPLTSFHLGRAAGCGGSGDVAVVPAGCVRRICNDTDDNAWCLCTSRFTSGACRNETHRHPP